MDTEWWVCTSCYRSNHPLWSHCQTCRALRPEAEKAADPAAIVSVPIKPAAIVNVPIKPAAMVNVPIKPAAIVNVPIKPHAAAEPQAAVEPVATPPPSAARSSRSKKAASSGEPTEPCPVCEFEMEAEWVLCPRCGWSREESDAGQLELLPLAPSEPTDNRSRRGLGLIQQPVDDATESKIVKIRHRREAS